MYHFVAKRNSTYFKLLLGKCKWYRKWKGTILLCASPFASNISSFNLNGRRSAVKRFPGNFELFHSPKIKCTHLRESATNCLLLHYENSTYKNKHFSLVRLHCCCMRLWAKITLCTKLCIFRNMHSAPIHTLLYMCSCVWRSANSSLELIFSFFLPGAKTAAHTPTAATTPTISKTPRIVFSFWAWQDLCVLRLVAASSATGRGNSCCSSWLLLLLILHSLWMWSRGWIPTLTRCNFSRQWNYCTGWLIYSVQV